MDILYKAQTRFLFHAHIKIKISAFYDNELFDELFGVLDDVDSQYNSYQSGSYIDQINKNAGNFVDVDDETVAILSEVIRLSGFFDGEYDITIMPLIRLWGFYKEEGRRIPSLAEIESVKPYINYHHIEIDGNRVRIHKGQEIITGSFIKAYAIDKLKEKMLTLGINDAVVNGGGSTILGINNEAHPAWQVAVRDADDDSLLFNIGVGNCCYSTSSQAKTFVDIDGRHYGHILSPSSGMPSLNKHVGIVSDSAMVGDIVSTALFNQTAQGFVEKIDKLKQHAYNIDGFMIDDHNAMNSSPGFEQYIL